jgi:alpha-tubulin suppressor-like RCC1 family protein
VFLTDDGEAWTCGAGEHGRNGNGGSGDVLAPEPVLALDDLTIASLDAGSAFTVALDDAGLVHVWGRNDQGQLGLGGGLAMDVYALEDLPRPIDLPDGSLLEAVAVSAGHSHAAIVTPDGRLLQWGAKNSLEPAEHVFSAPGADDDGGDGGGDGGDAAAVPKPAAVYCGGAYTLALDTEGLVYSFGQGGSKCLGHGDKKRRPHPLPVDALDGFRVSKVACGYRHVAALGTWDGAVAVAAP